MKVLSEELAALARAGAALDELARTVAAPDGKTYQFGPDGVAEVDDACGLDLVPGYVVVEGAPSAAALPGATVKPTPGPPVTFHADPRFVAPGTQVACPDGLTVACFLPDGRGNLAAVAPDNCGLAGHPHFSLAPVEHPTPQEPAGAAPAPADGPVLVYPPPKLQAPATEPAPAEAAAPAPGVEPVEPEPPTPEALRAAARARARAAKT